MLYHGHGGGGVFGSLVGWKTEVRLELTLGNEKPPFHGCHTRLCPELIEESPDMSALVHNRRVGLAFRQTMAQLPAAGQNPITCVPVFNV